MTDKNSTVSFSQEQLDAAVATATAQGHETGVREERERMNAILGSDEAKERPVAAKALVEAGMDAETAKTTLAKLPVEAKEPAPAPAPAPAPKGQTPFDRHMSAIEQPEVGADAPTTEMTDDEKGAAAIIGAAKAFKGTNTVAA